MMSSEKMKPKIINAKLFANGLCHFYNNLKKDATCEQCNNYDIEIKRQNDFDVVNSIGETIQVNKSSVPLSNGSQNEKEDSRDYFSKKYNLRWLPQREDLKSLESYLCPIEDINTFTDLIQKPVVHVVVNSNGAANDVVDDIKQNIDRSGEQVQISCSNEDLCMFAKNIDCDVTKEQADSDQVHFSVTNGLLRELIENIDKSTDIIQMPDDDRQRQKSVAPEKQECSVLLRDLFSEKIIFKLEPKAVSFIFNRQGNETRNSSASPTTITVNKKSMITKIKKEKKTKSNEPHKYKPKKIPKKLCKFNTKGRKKMKLRAPKQTSMELPNERASQVTTASNDIDVNELLTDAVDISDGNLEGASQVTAVSNVIDVNELQMDAVDIPNDNIDGLIDDNIDDNELKLLNGFKTFDDNIDYYALELSKYVDQNCPEFNSLLNNDQNVYSFPDSYTQDERIKIMFNDDYDPLFECELDNDQPLDLSKKKTTPSSTDTGFSNGSSLIELEDNWEMDIDKEDIVTEKTNYSSNKSLRSLENLGQRANEKLERNGSVTTHCYTNDQAFSYQATNFNNSVGSRETIKCQLSADKLDENGNARDQTLKYTATNMVSKESSSRSCASASNSSAQRDNNKMAQDNYSSIIGTPKNNLIIPKPKQISMNSTNIVNCIGHSSKLPTKPKWNDELHYDAITQEDIVQTLSRNNKQSSWNHILRSAATPSDNNYVGTSNNNVQPSCNRESTSVITPTNTNFVPIVNNNVQSSWIRDCQSVATQTNNNYVAASSNNLQPSWIRDAKSVATRCISNNQLTHPITPSILQNVLGRRPNNMKITISNHPSNLRSNHMSRVITNISSLQVIENNTSLDAIRY